MDGWMDGWIEMIGIERDRCRKCYSKCGKMNIWLILVMIWNSLYYSYKVSVKCEIILKQKVFKNQSKT